MGTLAPVAVRRAQAADMDALVELLRLLFTIEADFVFEATRHRRGLALLVEDVVVDEAWQGQGVGRQLMQALGKWAQSRNIGRLQLLADRNNQPALEFYNKLGWQTTELICLRQRLPDQTT